MKQSLISRAIVIAVVLIAFGVAAYPPAETIRLGLDLQGGMHMVLRVRTADAIETEAGKDMDRIQKELADLGVEGVTAERTGPTAFLIRGVPRDKEEEMENEIVDPYMPGWTYSREDDALQFELEGTQERQLSDLAVRQALETIRNRVDAYGVAEPAIHREGVGGDRIVVQLPGVDDPDRLRNIIQQTAFLEFRFVSEELPGPVATRQDLVDHFGSESPPGVVFAQEIQRDPDTKAAIGEQWWALEDRQVLTGRDLKTARPSTGEFNEPTVHFILTREGGRLFGEATGENIGRLLAIVLDEQVVSAPRIEARITDEGVIHGSFTFQEVQDLVTNLRSGALPAGIEILEERTVGPALGQDSIEDGRRAGLIGGVLVLLTLLVVYNLSGINAIAALTLNIVLVFGALAMVGATLTLPGIAGIILTIGMAVDANVLVFERIREELRSGRTVKSAIAAGFQKAMSSVIDANFTTLIAAAFLFIFGTGPIRGFAVTLSVGILASLFTALFVSRWIFDILYSRQQRVESMSI